MIHDTRSSFCPVNGESPEEERVNSITSLIGFVLSLIGTGVLVFFASRTHDMGYILGCSIYGASLIFLFGFSSWYHACKQPKRKRILRIIDHSCIFLVIAGTYTPFGLEPMRLYGGWYLLWIQWGIATVAIIVKIIAIERFHVLSVVAYLAMGWLVVFNLPAFIAHLPFNSLVWLVAGGISYSLGTLFYLWESLPFNHVIWHFFVLGGAICQFFSILDLVLHAIGN